jgi:hypothetical protein
VWSSCYDVGPYQQLGMTLVDCRNFIPYLSSRHFLTTRHSVSLPIFLLLSISQVWNRWAQLCNCHDLRYHKTPWWWVQCIISLLREPLVMSVIIVYLTLLPFKRWFGTPELLWLRMDFCYDMNIFSHDLWSSLLDLYGFIETSNHKYIVSSLSN